MDIKAFKMEIPKYVEELCGVLADSGFEAYAVGGCVRDSLLGNTPHDFDLTTSALPQQMKEVFSSYTVLETGIKHGTLTVMCGGSGVEITTFRVDGKYSDHRRPDEVKFTSSLCDDLARRDFTVNAFAYSEKTGLVDLFGGISDLEKGIIRCVGEADRRFEEDALRILRGLRFAARLGFSIEQNTAKSMIKKRELLKNVSSERVFCELCGFLEGKGEAVERLLIDFREVFAAVIPELSPCFDFDQRSPYHRYDVYTHIAKTVGACPPDRKIRLAALFHDIAKPLTFTADLAGNGHFYGHPEKSAKIAKEVLQRLRVDKNTAGAVERLVLIHDDELSPDRKTVARLLKNLGRDTFFDFCALKKADISSHAAPFACVGGIEEAEKTANCLLAENFCLSLKQLAVNGDDIKALGISGRQVGAVLQRLLDETVDGQTENERSALLSRAKAIVKSQK